MHQKKYFPQTIPQFILSFIIVVFLCCPFFLFSVYEVIPKNLFTTLNFILICIVFIFLFWLKNKHTKDFVQFNFRVNFLIIFLIGIVICYQIAINIPINFLGNNYLNGNKINRISNFYPTLPLIFLSALFEEIIFRGIMLKGLLMKYQPKKAIFMSALFFGIIHFLPMQSFGAFIFGLFVGYIYYLTRSVGVAIILHLFNNLAALFGVYLLNNYGNLKIQKISDFYGNFSPLLISASVLILMLILILFFIKKNIALRDLKSLRRKQSLIN